MRVTEIPFEIFLPSSKMPRSPGVHVSGIIRCMATESGILKNEWAEELSLLDIQTITDPVAVLRISIGLAWEQYYIPSILGPAMGVIDHPGEMYVDGIYMTQDGESIDVLVIDKEVYKPIIHEVKATYKSIRTVGDLSSQWMWMAQCKAYCKGSGTNICMMHILFLCGDYKYPIKPVLKIFKIEFTDEEIEENWDILTTYMRSKLEEKQ